MKFLPLFFDIKFNNFCQILENVGCSAVPRYPETHADLKRVKEACEAMNQDEEVVKAFENIRKLD